MEYVTVRKCSYNVIGRKCPPLQDVHVLIPRTHEYVSLHGKKDFTVVMKLRILRWRDNPELSRRA